MCRRASKKWGCVTSKALPLPSRNVVGCLLHPSDLLLLLSIAVQVGNVILLSRRSHSFICL